MTLETSIFKSVKSLAGHVQGGRIQGVASLEPSTRGRLHVGSLDVLRELLKSTEHV